MVQTEFILYVSDQEKSKHFYEQLLALKPTLHVPGMTEFSLSTHCKLGLMHENGIAKILGNKTPHPTSGNGIPRCEIYLKMNNALAYLQRGIQLGAKEISAFEQRDWGDKVGYLADFDGHIIAFAEK